MGLLISAYSKGNRVYGNSFINNGIQAENEGDLTNLFNLTPPLEVTTGATTPGRMKMGITSGTLPTPLAAEPTASPHQRSSAET